MEEREQMDKSLRDLIEIIHFTENVSVKIHGVLDEADIYRAVMEEFVKSKRYNVSIVLLTDDGSQLRIAGTSLTPRKLKTGEKLSGLLLKEYKITLNKSSIYSQVVREGKTVQVNSRDIMEELFSGPLVHLLSKIIGFKNEKSIVTPLKRHGKIVGALTMSSTDLVEHFIPSVKNLAQHISNVLELADERAIRKQMEEALRKSEEKFRDIFENASDCMIYLDSSGRILDVNRKAVKVFGGSKKELLGKPFTRIGVFSPREIPKLLSAFAKGLAGKPATLNVRIKNKKGQEIFLEGSASSMKVDDKVVGLVIARDVTERMKVEEALKESGQKLRDIIDTSPDAIVWVDTTGKITLVNRKGLEITGFSEKDLVGKNFVDVEALTQESKERILESFTKRLEEIDTPPYEVEIVTKSREVLPFELSASPIFEGDKIVGVQSILRDLRERKKAEEVLRESEAKFRNLAEQSPNMIFINKNGRVVYANKKCEEIMGYKREEFYSPDFSFLTLIAPESVDLVKSNFRRHMKGEEVAPYEYRLVTKEGKKIEAIITPKLIRYKGERAILGIITDITERKKAEEAVRHYSEHLEELVEKRTRELKEAQEQLLKSERLASIGEVATMVGHDLRNPLQSIENATYCLNNELLRLPIPQKTIEMLQVINDSVDYADKIIRDLHDFSATKKPILEKTSINAIVEDTLSQVEIPENVELITELSHLPEIKADKDMIKRAFLNLALNGIQAMENGGTLRVSTKKTKASVEVNFKDTGVGISKGGIKEIFAPFFTTKAKGMGMGLPICKKFVEIHGGSIEVESEEGKGSTFTVKLPT